MNDLTSFFSPGSVIITDRIDNVNRMIRMMNRYMGADIYDCRVFSVAQLAAEICDTHSALYTTGQIPRQITAAEATVIMQSILTEIGDKWIPDSSKCAGTASEILRILDQIRTNDTTPAFEECSVTRILELKRLMSEYESYLDKNGLLDKPALINRAFDILCQIEGKGESSKILSYYLPYLSTATDARCIMFSELPRKEDRFLKKLLTMVGIDAKAASFELPSGTPFTDSVKTCFIESYGAENEVKYMSCVINEGEYNYGDICVVYPSDTYENLIRGEFEKAGISYSFSRGTYAASEDYVSFMLDLLMFAASDYSYQKLEKAVHNPLFKIKGARRSYRKLLSDGIGWGRQRYDFLPSDGADFEDENYGEFVEFVRSVVDIMHSAGSNRQLMLRGLIRIAKDYMYSGDKGGIVLSDALERQAGAFAFLKDDGDVNLCIKQVEDYLRDLRLPGSESPDSVLLIPYGIPIVTDRRVLYALGLSTENISPTRAESPVLTDDELHRFVEGNVEDAASENQRRRRNFEQTLELFLIWNPEDGRRAFLSYSNYDTVGLLNNTVSLLYRDLMTRAGCKYDEIVKTGYKLPDGAVRFITSNEDTVLDIPRDSMTDFSSSSIQTLLGCPMRYYYKYIRHIPDVSFQERRPDRWLQANQKGNLFHRTVQDYVNQTFINSKTVELDELLLKTLFERRSEEMLKAQPYPSMAVVEAEKEECYEALRSYLTGMYRDFYERTDGRKKLVLGCELEFADYCYSGGSIYKDDAVDSEIDLTYNIRFKGSADRVDGYMEDDILCIELIDYKTGSPEIKHTEIKEGIQIQHYVYAGAVKEWAEHCREELESRFGCRIGSCRISSMKYIFPFEEPIGIIDVSDRVTDEKPAFPSETEGVLEVIIGNIQHNRPEAAMEFMEMQADLCIRQGAENKTDFCRFCSYTDICRVRG